MAETIAAAKADIESRLSAIESTESFTLFDHEPAVAQRGRSITISTFAITADFWRIAVRIYADTSAGAKEAQDTLDELVPAAEAVLLDGGYGPMEWAFDVLNDGQIQAAVILDVGREDYY